MNRKSVALALAAMLALGAGGAVAAIATDDTVGERDAAMAQQTEPAENYTTEVRDPHGVLTSADVDAAVETALSDEEMRSYFDDGESVHVELWAPQPDERRAVVSLSPGEAPNDTRVLANVWLDRQEVTGVEEPRTLDESTGISVELTDDGEFEFGSDARSDRSDDGRDATPESGEVVLNVETGGESVALDYHPANRTVVAGDETLTVDGE